MKRYKGLIFWDITLILLLTEIAIGIVSPDMHSIIVDFNWLALLLIFIAWGLSDLDLTFEALSSNGAIVLKWAYYIYLFSFSIYFFQCFILSSVKNEPIAKYIRIAFTVMAASSAVLFVVIQVLFLIRGRRQHPPHP